MKLMKSNLYFYFLKLCCFSGAVLIFSSVRQLLVLPWISRNDLGLFVDLTYLIFSYEVVLYLVVGVVPDYYVRLCKGAEANVSALKALRRINISSFFFPLLLVFLDFEFYVCFLLSVYFYFCGANALNLKVLFNRLDFVENYIYVFFRCIPYFLIVIFILLKMENIVYFFLLSLIFSEGFYFLRLRKVLIEKDYLFSGENEKVTRLGIKFLVFFLAYFLIGIAQRGEFAFSGYYFSESQYASFAMFASVVNFICNPIALLCGGGLLSLLVNADVRLNLKGFMLMLLAGLGVSTLVSLVSYLLFDFIYEVLYQSKSIFGAGVFALVIFFNIYFLIFRTVALRFLSPGLLFLSFFVLLSFLYFYARDDVFTFVDIFYSFRAIFLVGTVFVFILFKFRWYEK